MSTRTRMWGVVWMVVLGLWGLAGVHSPAEAVITIKRAEVVSGVAVVEGGNAPANATISWEGAPVTQANRGGNFAFQGVVPADCVGRLEDGVPADAVDVALAQCASVSDAPAPVPQTGQNLCFSASGFIACEGTGQDGDIQAGVSWPSPRFTDHGNGTVTDHLTGLIWLRDTNCFGGQTWQQALNAANGLASGSCGLSDGSAPRDWRLPNIKELQSLIDFGQVPPALPLGSPFTNVQLNPYWSSTTSRNLPHLAWVVILDRGNTVDAVKENAHFVWPVRGGD